MFKNIVTIMIFIIFTCFYMVTCQLSLHPNPVLIFSIWGRILKDCSSSGMSWWTWALWYRVKDNPTNAAVTFSESCPEIPWLMINISYNWRLIWLAGLENQHIVGGIQPLRERYHSVIWNFRETLACHVQWDNQRGTSFSGGNCQGRSFPTRENLTHPPRIAPFWNFLHIIHMNTNPF